MNQYAWAIYEYHLKDQYQKAIQMAVALEPDADHIWDTLAWLYYETGDKENALKAMEKAAKLNPERKQYRENLQKFKKKK